MPLFVMKRSAWFCTMTCTVVVSFAEKLRTVATLVSTVPFVVFAFTVTVTLLVIVCPAAMLGRTKATELPLSVPPEAETKVTLLGSVSVIVTFVSFTVDVFVAVMV